MSDKEQRTLTITFDGLCEPVNPGGLGCYGWVARANGKVVGNGRGVVAQGGPLATNNYAEWCALGKALRWLKDDLFKGKQYPDVVLILQGDSKLVVHQFAGTWRCNVAKLDECRQRCHELLRATGILDWTIEWIPREQNVEADMLSRTAYTEKTGQQPPERTNETHTQPAG